MSADGDGDGGGRAFRDLRHEVAQGRGEAAGKGQDGRLATQHAGSKVPRWEALHGRQASGLEAGTSAACAQRGA